MSERNQDEVTAAFERHTLEQRQYATREEFLAMSQHRQHAFIRDGGLVTETPVSVLLNPDPPRFGWGAVMWIAMACLILGYLISQLLYPAPS